MPGGLADCETGRPFVFLSLRPEFLVSAAEGYGSPPFCKEGTGVVLSLTIPNPTPLPYIPFPLSSDSQKPAQTAGCPLSTKTFYACPICYHSVNIFFNFFTSLSWNFNRFVVALATTR